MSSILQSKIKWFFNNLNVDISSYCVSYCLMLLKKSTGQWLRKSTGGAVVKNPPANAGETGLSPGLGRSHMLWSN